jgi:pyrroline-5-carboxylate reductase
MGRAIVRGLSDAGGYEVTACDPDPDARAAVESYCRMVSADPDDIAESGVVVVAVKPDTVGTVLEGVDLSEDRTLVTVAAGVPRAFVEARTDATVVRVMPNLAAESRTMAAAVAWDEVDDDVARMLDDLGEFVPVEEPLMDVATALNGSGPAFVYYYLGAMAKAAAAEGLDPADAETLAAQTVKGAAETVLRSERSVDELIEAVCSPNGTTIEGMAVLRESDVETVVAETLAAATERSRELAVEVDDG